MIDLAHSTDFSLGSIQVRPSSRELIGSGAPLMVEPKVMQVLVALADAGGRVVSRDELIEKCWSGRVVGEDAINRVIGKLRRVAEASGGVFRVETVARSGHRLLCDTIAIEGATATAMPTAGTRSWRWIWWLAPTAAATLLIGIVVGYRERVPFGHPAGPAGMPAAATDLETRGLSSMFENTPEQTAEGVGYLRQATALAPHAAPVWGSLAMSYVLSLGWTPPGERAAVSARVRDAANRGLGIDPRESRSAAALVSLEPTFGRWTAKAMGLAAAKARAYPDTGPLAYQEVQFLMATGQTQAALAAIRPVVATSPLVPWIRAAYIDLLAASGRLADADREADDAGRTWPRDRLIWFTRFDLAMFNGQSERSLAMAADRSAWPKQARDAEIERAARTARAIVSRNGAETDALLAALAATAPSSQADAERALRAAAALGRPGIALSVARRLYRDRPTATPRGTILPNIGLPSDADPPTAVLFLPPAEQLWGDPGFLALIKEIGLAAYWRHAGPPDICKMPQMRSRCRAASILG